MSNDRLIFMRLVGEDNEGNYEYDAYISDTPDLVWGEDWNENCPSACASILPQDSTYSSIVRYKSPVRLVCAQENTCFSMQDCIDGIISLVYYEMDDGSIPLIIPFAEEMDSVNEKLEILSIFPTSNNEEED